MTARRVILATFGSDGDVNPFIAVGVRLKALGLEPVLATRAAFEGAARDAGLGFHPVRPDMADMAAAGLDEAAAVRGLTNRATGLRFLFKRLILPFLHMTYDDLNAVVQDGDLLVRHQAMLAARVLAEARDVADLTAVLQPFSLMSPHDPPVLAVAPWLDALRPALGPVVYRTIFRLMAKVSAPWFAPVQALRAELGLGPGPANPMFESQGAARGGVLLYSRHFAPAPPDLAPGMVQAGFAFLDPPSGSGLDPALEAFLAAGPAPIVFTLGTTAVLNPGAFYQTGLEVAARLGRRAVLLAGAKAGLPAALPDGMIAVGYAPHALLFPHACAVVHQGGIGTSAQALRAGVPQLVVPFLGDQPDNAARLARLGVAKALACERFTADRAAPMLDDLLRAPGYAQRGAALRAAMAKEDGAGAAAAIIAAHAQGLG